jgi:hypothetical protein
MRIKKDKLTIKLIFGKITINKITIIEILKNI